MDKKVRRLTKHAEHARGKEHAQERAYLLQCRRRLIEERRRAQYYIRVPASDVPPHAHARPIYELTGRILTEAPERYAELLDQLRRDKDGGDER